MPPRQEGSDFRFWLTAESERHKTATRMLALECEVSPLAAGRKADMRNAGWTIQLESRLLKSVRHRVEGLCGLSCELGRSYPTSHHGRDSAPEPHLGRCSRESEAAPRLT